MTFDEIKAEAIGFFDHESLIKVIHDLGGITHIMSHRDTIEKYGFMNQFNQFHDDDWDYFIVGPKFEAVVEVAEVLFVCDYVTKEIDGVHFAMTYHA